MTQQAQTNTAAPISEKAAARKAMRGLALFVVGAILAPVLVGYAGGNYWVRVLDFAMLYIMLALGLNIVVGFAGLLDLGYIAFYAVGAYVTALLTSPHLTEHFPAIARMFPHGLHFSVWLTIPLGAAMAAIFGILLGTPTLRLRGDYLAIVTLGFGEIVRIFMNNLDRPINITNGPKGIIGIRSVDIAGVDFAKTQHFLGLQIPSVYMYYYLFVLLALIVAFICIRLQHSRIGRAWVAIREDEIAAKAMGINTRNVKLLAFAMGASFGGVAGGMFSAFQGFVSPESFTFWESVIVLSMVVLGGMGHIPGVILGGIALSTFPEFLRSTLGPMQQSMFGHVYIDPEVARQLLYSLAMILIMLYRPAGLWPSPRPEERPMTTS